MKVKLNDLTYAILHETKGLLGFWKRGKREKERMTENKEGRVGRNFFHSACFHSSKFEEGR